MNIAGLRPKGMIFEVCSEEGLKYYITRFIKDNNLSLGIRDINFFTLLNWP